MEKLVSVSKVVTGIKSELRVIQIAPPKRQQEAIPGFI